jgi:DNA-binding PadR family transcriptional regulator
MESMIADLSGFQRDLLFVISSNDSDNGLTIRDDLSDYRGEKIHHGRLYPNLDELVELGLVDKSQQTERANSYSLTDDGRAVLERRVAWTAAMTDATDSDTDVDEDDAEGAAS